MRRKEETCWVDPRFRKKRDKPKAIKLGVLGQTPAPIERPSYRTSAAIPAGMAVVCPPCPPGTRPAAPMVCPPGTRPAGVAVVCPPGTRPAVPVVCPPGTRPAGGTAVVCPPGTRPAIFAAASPRPPPSQTGAIPKSSSVVRTSSQRKQVVVTSTPGTTPRRAIPRLGIPRRVAVAPCPPAPCPADPCSPEPSTSDPCLPIACIPTPRASGLRAPMYGRSRLRPPSTSTAANLTAMRARSPVVCVAEPCPPCVPDPCPPCVPDPCQPESSASLTVARKKRVRFLSPTRSPPSRLMAPGSIARRQEPKPQKIVLLPGDIDPAETTVITVEPPPRAPSSPRRSLSPRRSRSPTVAQLCIPRLPMDDSPPSMESFMRNPMMPQVYIPPEIQSYLDTLPKPGQEEPAPEDQPMTVETSSGLLIDVSPLDPSTMESQVCIEPVDLITFSPQDPFSPERVCRPASPSVSPPPIPFSPPKDPLPEPSDLHKWYSQYPQYRQAFASTSHPILEYSRFRKPKPPSPPMTLGGRRSPRCVDRELKAKTVPFNTEMATICRDDSDEEDLGLLPACISEEYLTTAIDYESIRRRQEEERQERLAWRKEEERRIKGPSIAETRAMLERVRETETARRAALEAMQPCPPPPIPMEVNRERYRRLLAKAQRIGAIGAESNILSNVPETYSMLQDVTMEEEDLDDFDFLDECPD